MKFKEVRIPTADLARIYNYIRREDADHAVISTNILAGDDVEELDKIAALRPDCPSAYLHWVLAFPQNDLANLNPALLKSVWRRFFQLMEVPATCKYVVATHGADMQHSHALVSRIGTDASIWLARFSVRKGIKATAQLEKEFGLTITPTLDYSSAQNRRPQLTKHEFEQKKRTGLPVRKEVIIDIIETSIQRSEGAFPSFLKACEEQGLAPHVVERENGSKGISFVFENVSYRGSKLGRGYSYGNLIKTLALIEAGGRDIRAPQQRPVEERLEDLKQAAALNSLPEVATPQQQIEAQSMKRTLVERLDKLRIECPPELAYQVTILFYVVSWRLYMPKFYHAIKAQVKMLEIESRDLVAEKKREVERRRQEMVRGYQIDI
jgi:hypothetical protein